MILNFSTIANSWWMYLIAIVVVIFVLFSALFFIWRAYKDAKTIGMDKSVLKKTLINSALFTLVPSISILIGVVALSGTLGIPLPWIRLSVIGALHYEGAAVEAAYGSMTLASMTSVKFVTIAFIMTLGIITGPLFCLFAFKAYDKKILSKAKIGNEETEETEGTEENDGNTSNSKPKKKSFGPILFNAAFIAMIIGFLADDISLIFTGYSASEITNAERYGEYMLNTYTPLIVIGVSFLSMFIFDVLKRKFHQKWLANFDLGFSMLMGMAVAILLK